MSNGETSQLCDLFRLSRYHVQNFNESTWQNSTQLKEEVYRQQQGSQDGGYMECLRVNSIFIEYFLAQFLFAIHVHAHVCTCACLFVEDAVQSQISFLGNFPFAYLSQHLFLGLWLTY